MHRALTAHNPHLEPIKHLEPARHRGPVKQTGPIKPILTRLGVLAWLTVLTTLMALAIVLSIGLFAPAPAAGQFDGPEPGTCMIGELVETQLSQTQCNALIAIYWATDGPAWSAQLGWDTQTDPCTWGGVMCATRPGYDVVEQLVLHKNNLNGYLPEQIDGLIELRKLHLADNNITGPIPEHLGHLQSLQVVDLSGNRFEGQIPPRIGDLPNLRILNLADNVLDGEIPEAFTKLEHLALLRLEQNGCLAVAPATAEFVRSIVEVGDLDRCGSPSMTASCFAGRGRIDVGITNETSATAVYTTQVGSLAPRDRTIPPGAVANVAVTGRRNGPLDVTVFRNGEQIRHRLATIDCPDNGPPDGKVQAQSNVITTAGRCVGEGPSARRLDTKITNSSGATAIYRVLVEGLSPRQIVVGSDRTATVTVVPKAVSPMQVQVTRNGADVFAGQVSFGC